MRRSTSVTRARSCPCHLARRSFRTGAEKGFVDGKGRQQMQVKEAFDKRESLSFATKTLEHVSVPEVPDEARQETEWEREKRVRNKFGIDGPGEVPTQNSFAMLADSTKAMVDVDNLPWDVRYKKYEMETRAESLQRLKDQFDLWYQDPIEREQAWYLYHKDLQFYRLAEDRQIWAQGWTDYLDHYDQNGRRRILPGSKENSTLEWKQLSDANYRSRMWMISQEEKDAIDTELSFTYDEKQKMLAEGYQEAMDTKWANTMGLFDPSDSSVYEQLAGSSNPKAIEETVMKLKDYELEVVQKKLEMRKESADPDAGDDLAQLVETVGPDGNIKLPALDPVTGKIKSDQKPLPSGLTVEQAFAIREQVTQELAAKRQEQLEAAGQVPGNSFAAQIEKGGKSSTVPTLQVEMTGEETEPEAAGLTRKIVERVLQGSSEARLIASDTPTKDTLRIPQAAPSTGFIETSDHELPLTEELDEEALRSEAGISSSIASLMTESDKAAGPKHESPVMSTVEPLVRQYGTVKDPLSNEAVQKYYHDPPAVKLFTADTDQLTSSGRSSFNHYFVKETVFQEEMKPLPLLSEVKKEKQLSREEINDSVSPYDEHGNKLKRSELVRRQRTARALHQANQTSIQTLPDLPWEMDPAYSRNTDGTVDDATSVTLLEYEREKLFDHFKGVILQTAVEMKRVVSSSNRGVHAAELVIRDSVEKVRNGSSLDAMINSSLIEKVKGAGNKRALQTFALYVEFNLMVQYCGLLRGTLGQQHAAKQEERVREIEKRLLLVTKSCGRSFSEWLFARIEKEDAAQKANPTNYEDPNSITVVDSNHGRVLESFNALLHNDLPSFRSANFAAREQLQQHVDVLEKTINSTARNVPSSFEGIPDQVVKSLIEAMRLRLLGDLFFFQAKHLLEFHLTFAEYRFRQEASNEARKAREYHEASFKISSAIGLCMSLVNTSQPQVDYRKARPQFAADKDPMALETQGDIFNAEAGWMLGLNNLTWYRKFDRTHTALFYERRLLIEQCLAESQKTLMDMNERTHPSIHPFPDAAKVWLEGAPLSQETAEHLWLRNMGDVYMMHSQLMLRLGKFGTSEEYADFGRKHYKVALRTAKESLPPQWMAPLYTKARYLLALPNPKTPNEAQKRLDVIMATVESIHSIPMVKTAHWCDFSHPLATRVSICLLDAALECQTLVALAQAQAAIGDPTVLIKVMQARAARTEHMVPEARKFDQLLNKPNLQFRKKILEIRDDMARRAATGPSSSGDGYFSRGSDEYHMLTFVAYKLRVKPTSLAEVEEFKKDFLPTYRYLSTEAAMGSTFSSRSLVSFCVRSLCTILSAGDKTHKEELLKELNTAGETLSSYVDSEELQMTVEALEIHLKQLTALKVGKSGGGEEIVQPYIYLSKRLTTEMQRKHEVENNPLLAASRLNEKKKQGILSDGGESSRSDLGIQNKYLGVDVGSLPELEGLE